MHKHVPRLRHVSFDAHHGVYANGELTSGRQDHKSIGLLIEVAIALQITS